MDSPADRAGGRAGPLEPGQGGDRPGWTRGGDTDSFRGSFTAGAQTAGGAGHNKQSNMMCFDV